ncbi:hypothetical protein MKK54_24405, partial [Methylobacterium sp. J-068]|nr:hypothetical protein [Methylobacterium sp. J-068]
LALWFALAVLGLAPLAGFGIWPRRAMTTADALLAMALACAAFLPHLLCDGLREREDRSARGHRPARAPA